jgi:hypothetical protein
MKKVCFNQMIHLLGEFRYRLNGTPLTAHSGVATPWNRITIPRRCAPYMDVQVSQAQEVQERPLLCTLMDTPFNLSNCGF